MDKAIEIVLALVIVGCTMAFGGVQPLAYTLMELGIYAAVLLLVLKQTRQGRINLPLPFWPLLFALLVVIQLIPLPLWLIMKLSALRSLGSVAGGPLAGNITLSIYPHATLLALAKLVAYLGAFLLAAYVFDSRKRKSALIQVLVLLGGFEAAYGMFQYLTGLQKIFAYTKVYDLSEATGTYINRNHFAGLLELTLPFVTASVFYSFQLWSQGRLGGASRRHSAERTAAAYRSLFYSFLLVIMVLAVVFSRSRGGIAATFLSLGFVIVLTQLKSRRDKVWASGVLLFLACVIGFGLWIGLGPVLARFDEGTSLGLGGRILLWKDELNAIRDYRIVGAGLGTFGDGFRRYQTTLADSFVEHAHNDYLQSTFETGVLGVMTLFLPILYLLIRMIISFMRDQRRYRGAVTLGCAGSVLALLLHSVTDFNLQISANALIFAVVLGIGYKVVCLEQGGEDVESIASESLAVASSHHVAL